MQVNLKAIKRIMENDGMDLEIIVNHKQSDKGEPVIQLETAVGAAIKRAFSTSSSPSFTPMLISPLSPARRLQQRPRHQRPPFAFPPRQVLL